MVSFSTRPLGREFYERSALTVARELLGKVLVREFGDVNLKGMIVEVEAYRGADDPASHAYKGKTTRNAVMFQQPGLAYVYFTYGNHYCLNVVTETDLAPGAVLVRAIEPLEGLNEMRENRGVEDEHQLTNGPGKLTKAFGIDKTLNSHDLTVGRTLWLAESDYRDFKISSSPRIGIRDGIDKKWRFYIEDNPFLSRLTSTKPRTHKK